MGKTLKVRAGEYLYRNYRLKDCGYYSPDSCVWWEAVNVETDGADHHAHTKGELIRMIDEEIERNEE